MLRSGGKFAIRRDLHQILFFFVLPNDTELTSGNNNIINVLLIPYVLGFIFYRLDIP